MNTLAQVIVEGMKEVFKLGRRDGNFFPEIPMRDGSFVIYPIMSPIACDNPLLVITINHTWTQVQVYMDL